MSEAVSESAEAVDTSLPEGESEAGSAGGAAPAGGAQAMADAVDPVKVGKIKLDDGEYDAAEVKAWREASTKRKELDRAAYAKFEEASKWRKQMESLKEADPEEFFKLRGIDPTEYAVQKLQRELQMREATPDQRRIMELEARAQQYEMEKQQGQQQQEHARFEQERQSYVQKLDKELPAAVSKHGLPSDPLVFSAVARVLQSQIENDMPEDYEAAAEQVAEAYRDSFKNHTATLKYEDVVKQYPDLIKLIREGDLARVNTAPKPTRPGTQSSAPKRPAEQQPPGAQKFNDYFDPWAGLVQKPT